MATEERRRLLTLAVFFAIAVAPASAVTDFLDVMALGDLYTALNRPEQLERWSSWPGDPCRQSWTGVFCSGSSILYLDLHGLNISGYLGNQLHNLRNLKQLDLSYNSIHGEIPHSLPPNATLINMSCNNLTQSIPFSLVSMNHLRRLNLSHNSLSGPIGDVFRGLYNLKELDLSFNSFTGDLPSSFSQLTNLTKLYLQSNSFTGSVIFLSNISLFDLDVRDNNFSGEIPKQFEYIQNLWIGGNKFYPGGNYEPWHFPLDPLPKGIKNPSTHLRPPSTQSNAIESYPQNDKNTKNSWRRRRLSHGVIASIVVSSALLLCAAAGIAFAMKQSHHRKKTNTMWENTNTNTSTDSFPISTLPGHSSGSSEGSHSLSSLRSPMVHGPSSYNYNSRQHHQMGREDNMKKNSFCNTHRIPITAKLYTLEDILSATNFFSPHTLLGEGTLGSVYRADFSDGRISAVKNINTVGMSVEEETRFLNAIGTVSRLRHPNIITLTGYCMDGGRHLLVYDFIRRSSSLEDALHGRDCCKPLPWHIRLQVAIGVARALDYMHSAFVLPVSHGNLKAANVLLDEDFVPRVCDSGISILRPLPGNSVKLKASKVAIWNTGYIAPEHGECGVDATKMDVYTFGVLLLELLTGSRPFCPKREGEKCLVKWAANQLHDRESLEEMVDPKMKRSIPSKFLSQYADIVSLCIQVHKEFRPAMAEVVESLVRLQRATVMSGSEVFDHLERSFRSTNSCFTTSPPALC